MLSDAKKGDSSAQFELALLSFGDVLSLSAIRQDVDFADMVCQTDYDAAFDWLEFAIKNKNKQAISDFEYRQAGEEDFQQEYLRFKDEKPYTILQKYEKYLTLTHKPGE